MHSSQNKVVFNMFFFFNHLNCKMEGNKRKLKLWFLSDPSHIPGVQQYHGTVGCSIASFLSQLVLNVPEQSNPAARLLARTTWVKLFAVCDFPGCCGLNSVFQKLIRGSPKVPRT